MGTLLSTILVTSLLGALLALLLYVIAKRFHVEEDARIDEVEKILPGANCGGCGFAGCRAMAEALVSREDISSLNCPVGGGECMGKIAAFLGKQVAVQDPLVAVVRCGGSCANRPRVNTFDGAQSCAVAASLYAGQTGCTYGCIGLGDCTLKCDFGAIKMNPETGLPEVDDEKCTACGACVKACPKMIIELRKKAPKGRKIYVSCVNKDKGAVARKACKVACIGCGKCAKVCAHDAITIENNLAYIDATKCKMCRKCVVECPTGAIVEVGFPVRKPAPEVAPKSEEVKAAAPKAEAPKVEVKPIETANNE